jgi:hypothetical protein
VTLAEVGFSECDAIDFVGCVLGSSCCFLMSALRVSLVVRSSIFEFSIIVLMVMDVDRLNGWN